MPFDYSTVLPGACKRAVGSALLSSGQVYQNAGQYLPFYKGGNQVNNMWGYCGLGVDTIRGRVMSVRNGGHADGGDNGVYGCNIATLDWLRDLSPTFDIIPVLDVGIPDSYIDSAGTYGPQNGVWPAAAHTYGGVVFMPTVGPNGTFWLAGGYKWERTGTQTNKTWHYDPVTHVYSLQSETMLDTSFVGLAAAWDSKLQVVIIKGPSLLYIYDPFAIQGSRYRQVGVGEGAGNVGGLENGFFDRRRRRFVIFGSNASTSFTFGARYYDFMNWNGVSALSPVNLPLSNIPGGSFTGVNDGMLCDHLRDLYVWWTANRRLIAFDPDTGIGTTIDCSGDDPGVGIPSGTINRFIYSEPLDVYLLFNNVDQDIHVFRHPDQSRVVALPNQSWKAYPYPPNGTLNSKLNAFDGPKHFNGFPDEKRGLVIIGGGDTNENVPTVGSFAAFGAELDSNPRVGSLNLKTGPVTAAWAQVKPAVGSPPTEWALNRSDNGPFLHIYNKGAFAIDDLYAWIPGFQGATLLDATNTQVLAAQNATCMLPSKFKGAEMQLAVGDFVGTLVAEKTTPVAGTGTVQIANNSTAAVFSISQSFVAGDIFRVNDGTGEPCVIESGSGFSYTINKPYTQNGGSGLTFVIAGTWVATNFYDFDAAAQSASIVFASANTAEYRSFFEGGNLFYRVRASVRTSGSVSCAMKTGNTLDAMAWAWNSRTPDQHGKPLPTGFVAFFDPAAASAVGTGKWIASKGWIANYGGDGSNTGQGFYDRVSHHIYHFGGNSQMVGLNCATGVYDRFYPFGSSITNNLEDIYRFTIVGDIYARKAYFFARYPGDVAKIVQVNIDTPGAGAASFVPGGTIPGWLDLFSGGNQVPLAFDSTNRVLGFPLMQAMGGTLYGWRIFDVDTGAWETPTIVSADFPASGSLNPLIANAVIFDTFHNAFIVCGGSGGEGYAAGIWRYAGGPTTAAPAGTPNPSVSDGVNSSEFVSLQFGIVGLLSPSVSDSIRDDIVPGEFVSVGLSASQIIVADTRSVGESVSILLGARQVVASDTVTPGDVVVIQLTGPPPTLSISVFDADNPTDAAHAGGSLSVEPPDTQGGGGCGDPADLWRPTWLIDLTGITPTPSGYSATELRFSHVDIDALSPVYHGRLVDLPTVDRKLVDVFWGVTDIAEIQFTLANADGYLTNLYLLADLREQPVIIQRYDIASGVIADTVNGRISSVGLENGKLILRVASVAVTLSEQLIPSKLITAEQFPKAVDLQSVIPVVFGNPIQMLCPYINDNTLQNEYDYIVGYGTLNVVKLYRNGPNNTMVTISAPEYTVSTSLYPGYTAVRFPERQVDFNNQFHKIYADVIGTSRNFADAVKDILTNATWGLGQVVDVGSFAAAATTLDNLSAMFCDGVLATQHQAQDVLRQLLIVRGMRLGFNTVGQWTLAVDRVQDTVTMVARDGIGDGERTLVTTGPRVRAETQNAVSVYTVKYRPDFPNGSAFQFSQARTVNAFGKEKIFEALFVRDHTAADMICDYLAKREQYGQDTCQLELSQEGRRLIEGNLVQVFYAPTGYAGDIVEVREVAKTLETVRVTVASWSPAIYVYQAGILPSDTPPPVGPPSTLSAPATPAGLVMLSDTFIDTDGQAQVFLDIGWMQNLETDIQGYEIQFKRTIDPIWTSRQVGK
jgi:hypothetical protein